MTDELLDAWADEQDARRKARMDNPVRLVKPGSFPAPKSGWRIGMSVKPKPARKEASK